LLGARIAGIMRVKRVAATPNPARARSGRKSLLIDTLTRFGYLKNPYISLYIYRVLSIIHTTLFIDVMIQKLIIP